MNRYVFLLFVTACNCLMQSQNKIVPLGFTEDSISVNVNIKIKDAISFQNLLVTFEDVLSDARCPKDSHCKTIGNAKMLLTIYKDGQMLQKKEITIDGEGYIFENKNLIFKTEKYKIFASELYPRPSLSQEIPKESYNANFFVMRYYGQ